VFHQSRVFYLPVCCLWIQKFKFTKLQDPCCLKWVWKLACGKNVGLRLFENRALSKVLDSMRTQVAGDWRRVHNEELREFYSPNTSYNSGDKMKYEMDMARTTRVKKCAAKMQRKRQSPRSRCRWENNITRIFKIRWERANWVHIAQDTEKWRALVMNLEVP